MLRSLLYDKEISVTLYKDPEAYKPGYKSSIVQGYSETVLNGKRKLYNTNISTLEKASPLGGSNPVTESIEFYEKSADRIFAGYKKKRDGTEVAVYKKIPFSGRVYYVDTIDQMKAGKSLRGTYFGTGDRIYVKEDSSVWEAVVWEGSTVVAPTAIPLEEPAELLEINTTPSGLKPDIALSISLLPGQNCYGATLKIRNLNLDPLDIRKWKTMVITAGYRTGKKVKYTCPIFTSYIESPNPDGVTTFEGITVGTADDVLNDQMIEIHFVQEKMTLRALTEGVARAISSNITVSTVIADEIMNREITISKQTVYAQNGMAVLNWLQSTITKFIETISEENGSRISAFIQLVDNTLEIIALNGPNKMPSRVQSVVDLNMVSGATFNGTALTVEAPWNPDLTPGGLFYMPPEFIYGSKLPNVLPEEDYRNDDNLYRALTMSISFASVESANKMTVLAVPAQWAGEMPTYRSTEMRGDLFARALADASDLTGVPVFVGDTGAQDAAKVNNVTKEEATHVEMYDKYGKSIISIWGAWTDMKIEARPNECLSKILSRYLLEDPNGPQLTPGARGKGKEEFYYMTAAELKDEGYTKAIEHLQKGGINANPVWWPLVTVGTYWRRKIDEEAKVSNNWNTAEPDNPDFVDVNKSLYIPVFTTWSSMIGKLKQLKDIYKYAYKEFGKGKKETYAWLAPIWRAMYYYLGGTDELD